MTTARFAGLAHPVPEPPQPGRMIEIAPGILWARLPLPFRLDHVNVYAIDDSNGWAIVDAGLGDQATKEAWERLLAGPLAGRRLTRLIVTHMHPDHIGAAGWLADRLSLPIDMTEAEYLSATLLLSNPDATAGESYHDFYVHNGLDPTTAEVVMTRGQDYLRMLTGLPKTFRRILAGDRLVIGGRSFEALTGGGHSREQIMLHLPGEKLFVAADQVLARISPNVSVQASDPLADPLDIFLCSLRGLKETIAADALVLPGHDLPFIGLHSRIGEIIAHHEERCEAIMEACRITPHSAAELVPLVFRRELDAHQTGFAFGEIMAHVNHMIRRQRLTTVRDPNGLQRMVAR